MKSKYVYDNIQVSFRKFGRDVRGVVVTVLIYFCASIVLAILYYFIVSLFFSTDVEHRLKRENKMYAKVYPELVKKDNMLSEVVAGIQIRDNGIYEDIFYASALNVDWLPAVDFYSNKGNLRESDIITVTDTKLSELETSSKTIEENFMRIFTKCCEDFYMMPPMNLPLKDFSISSTGASVGTKISPFFKVDTEHKGLDMVAAAGTPVYATGPGVVTTVTKSGKGQGNVVEITHFGGFTTRYAHLDEISVRKGSKVDVGTVIGKVGNTGLSFAPHLHYEVLKDGSVEDPVNYFFSTLSPTEYAELMVMSVMIKQTME